MANIDKLQKELRKLARVVTLLPSAFADDGTADLEGGIPTALYSIIRSRLTTLLALRLTPHQDAPAAAIIRTHVGQHGRTNVSSWVATTIEFLQHYSNIGAGPYDDIRSILELNREPHLGDVTRAAQVFARRACNAALRTAFLAENGGGAAHINGLSQRPPVDEGPAQQCHALSLSYLHYNNDFLGTLPFTPMSYRGPGGGGCPLPLTTALLSEAQRGALAFIRLGAVALSASPLGVPAWRITSTGKGARKNFSDPETWRLAKRGRPCPLCVGATADPFHVIHECTHPDVVAARHVARSKTLRYVPVLLEKMEKAADSAGRFSQPPPSGGWRAPANLLEAHSWESTTSGNFLLRLLAAAPWPAAAVDSRDAPLAHHLGRCFDAARLSNTNLHTVYNDWAAKGDAAPPRRGRAAALAGKTLATGKRAGAQQGGRGRVCNQGALLRLCGQPRCRRGAHAGGRPGGAGGARKTSYLPTANQIIIAKKIANKRKRANPNSPPPPPPPPTAPNVPLLAPHPLTPNGWAQLPHAPFFS
jgi:hypothetical protein